MYSSVENFRFPRAIIYVRKSSLKNRVKYEQLKSQSHKKKTRPKFNPKTIFVMWASMQIGDVYHILYECQVTAQGECKFRQFLF